MAPEPTTPHQFREITVFTCGDSSKPRTWSNIPYFFTQTLISKGLKVNRVDISPVAFSRLPAQSRSEDNSGTGNGSAQPRRLDLNPTHPLKRLYLKVGATLHKNTLGRLFPGTSYSWFRSSPYFFLVQRRIAKGLFEYPNA